MKLEASITMPAGYWSGWSISIDGSESGLVSIEPGEYWTVDFTAEVMRELLGFNIDHDPGDED